eukprot:3276267-Amphidinium_carterae.1
MQAVQEQQWTYAQAMSKPMVHARSMREDFLASELRACRSQEEYMVKEGRPMRNSSCRPRMNFRLSLA